MHSSLQSTIPSQVICRFVGGQRDSCAARTDSLGAFERPRSGDWDKTADDDQAFLMVQVMETWFIADRAALRKFFGADFRDGAIPNWPDLEKVPIRCLRCAWKSLGSLRPKVRRRGGSSDLLATTSPAKVQEASPHARNLFDRLGEIALMSERHHRVHLGRASGGMTHAARAKSRGGITIKAAGSSAETW